MKFLMCLVLVLGCFCSDVSAGVGTPGMQSRQETRQCNRQNRRAKLVSGFRGRRSVRKNNRAERNLDRAIRLESRKVRSCGC